MTGPDNLLALEDFLPLVGKRFRVAAAAAALELTLLEATPLPAPRNAGNLPGRQQPFSLIFTGPADRLLPQATHALTPEGRAELQIFLVPIARDAAGVRYQAIFA